MHSKLLVAAFIIICSLQSTFGIEAGLDFKIGLNIAKCFYEDEPNNPYYGIKNSKPIYSVTGGLAIPITVAEMFIIQPEILYSQTGSTYESKDNISTGSIKFSYLDIPLLFKLNIPNDSRITPNIFVGSSLSFLLSVKEKTESNVQYSETLSIESTGKDYYEDIAIHLIFGGGLNFGLPKGHLITDVRFNLGLTSVDPNDEDWKNRGVSLLLGYGFDF